jgi:hypothetical protein
VDNDNNDDETRQVEDRRSESRERSASPELVPSRAASAAATGAACEDMDTTESEE